MNAMVTEIDRIAGTTTWIGANLVEDETGTAFSFQVGATTNLVVMQYASQPLPV